MDAPEPRLTALDARLHLFVQPRFRPAFTSLFRDTLGCHTAEFDFGLPDPILLVTFQDGSAFSVEFSDLAHTPPTGAPVTDQTAFRGPWIEFRATDVPGVQQQLRDAGLSEFRHPGSAHSYFAAPGGQVFPVLDVSYRGP